MEAFSIKDNIFVLFEKSKTIYFYNFTSDEVKSHTEVEDSTIKSFCYEAN